MLVRGTVCLVIIITSINNNVELLQMKFSLHGLAKLEKGSPVESSLFYMNYCISSMTQHGFVDFCPLQCPKTVMAVKNTINK